MVWLDVKPPILVKYLNEFSRRQGKKRDTPPIRSATATAIATRAAAEAESRYASSFESDRPFEEL